jgi:hypothetical protein
VVGRRLNHESPVGRVEGDEDEGAVEKGEGHNRGEGGLRKTPWEGVARCP